jgi:dTDP-4-amino-4,6-dideoxygalactose transaminase
MIPRGQIDISISEIFRGIGYCLADFSGVAKTSDDSDRNNNNQHQLICLSVRTGFDLLLTALSLPPGSEIIVSNISIPGMFAIIEAHQLVAIPVSVDKSTLHISEEEIEKSLSTKPELY